MARKVKPKKKKNDVSFISPSRLKRIPGKSRQYAVINPLKGEPKTLSRRQAEKILKRTPRRDARIINKKLDAYYSLLDSYIQKEAEKGNKIGRGKARESAEMKQLVKDLRKGAKLKKTYKKMEGEKLIYEALKKTKRGDKVIWGDEGMVSISQGQL